MYDNYHIISMFRSGPQSKDSSGAQQRTSGHYSTVGGAGHPSTGGAGSPQSKMRPPTHPILQDGKKIKSENSLTIRLDVKK